MAAPPESVSSRRGSPAFGVLYVVLPCQPGRLAEELGPTAGLCAPMREPCRRGEACSAPRFLWGALRQRSRPAGRALSGNLVLPLRAFRDLAVIPADAKSCPCGFVLVRDVGLGPCRLVVSISSCGTVVGEAWVASAGALVHNQSHPLSKQKWHTHGKTSNNVL